MITTIIICTLISLALNFALVCLSTYVALKAVSKQLSAVIDECEKMDRDELFVKQWVKHNR